MSSKELRNHLSTWMQLTIYMQNSEFGCFIKWVCCLVFSRRVNNSIIKQEELCKNRMCFLCSEGNTTPYICVHLATCFKYYFAFSHYCWLTGDVYFWKHLLLFLIVFCLSLFFSKMELNFISSGCVPQFSLKRVFTNHYNLF